MVDLYLDFELVEVLGRTLGGILAELAFWGPRTRGPAHVVANCAPEEVAEADEAAAEGASLEALD